MTSQEKGADWEEVVAKLVDGKRTVGSGNRSWSVLDVNSGLLVIEAKHTNAESFRVTPQILDDIARQALGPSAGSMASGVLAIRVGEQKRRLAVVDLDELVGWLRSPPELLPATPNERLRATARVPSLLRG
jgi:hypothetical protein